MPCNVSGNVLSGSDAHDPQVVKLDNRGNVLVSWRQTVTCDEHNFAIDNVFARAYSDCKGLWGHAVDISSSTDDDGLESIDTTHDARGQSVDSNERGASLEAWQATNDDGVYNIFARRCVLRVMPSIAAILEHHRSEHHARVAGAQ